MGVKTGGESLDIFLEFSLPDDLQDMFLFYFVLFCCWHSFVT